MNGDRLGGNQRPESDMPPAGSSRPNARPVDDDTIPGPRVDVDTAHPGDDAPLSALLSRLVEDLSLLLRQEVTLAKAELRRELMTVAKASGMLAAGGLLAFVTLLLLAWAAAWGLAELVAPGVAFLIVGVVFGAIAAGIVAAGRKRLREVDVTPHETIDSVQKDAKVLSERTPR